jgi:DNA modification methylase
MGSGMLPAGAYVTLEHEHILVLRKAEKRAFATLQQKQLRRESAYFWEERNLWFSDVWVDLKGVSQNIDDTSSRKRSAAFPMEIPYRLINMYSVKGDVVVDPFMGTGTTALAAIAAGRNSVGFEIEPAFKTAICNNLDQAVPISQARISERLTHHQKFIQARRIRGETFKHYNCHYNTPVKTRQETDLFISSPISLNIADDLHVSVTYDDS